MVLLDPLVGGVHSYPATYGNPVVVTVPTGTQPGDVLVMIAAGRSADFALPADWTSWWSATGSGEASFTTPLVCARIAPDPVPASYTLTPTPSFDWSASMAAYRGGLLIPAKSLASFDTAANTNASSSSAASADPGSMTAARAGKAIILIAANSGLNNEIVNYSSASWRGVVSVTGTSRMTTAIFDIDMASGAVDHPAVSMDRTEPRAFMVMPFYNRHKYETVIY